MDAYKALIKKSLNDLNKQRYILFAWIRMLDIVYLFIFFNLWNWVNLFQKLLTYLHNMTGKIRFNKVLKILHFFIV